MKSSQIPSFMSTCAFRGAFSLPFPVKASTFFSSFQSSTVLPVSHFLCSALYLFLTLPCPALPGAIILSRAAKPFTSCLDPVRERETRSRLSDPRNLAAILERAAKTCYRVPLALSYHGQLTQVSNSQS
jgi:hypothetical protein